MKKEQFLLRMPIKLKNDLEKIATKKGISQTGLILIVLDNYVNKHRKE